MNRLSCLLLCLTVLFHACGNEEADPICEEQINLGVLELTQAAKDAIPEAFTMEEDFVLENAQGDQVTFKYNNQFIGVEEAGEVTITCEDGINETKYTYTQVEDTYFYFPINFEDRFGDLGVTIFLEDLPLETGQGPEFVDFLRVETFRGEYLLFQQVSDRGTGRAIEGDFFGKAMELAEVEILGEMFSNVLVNAEDNIYFKLGEGIVAMRDLNGELWKRIP